MELSIAVGALPFYPFDRTLAIARDAGVSHVEVLLSRRLISIGGESISAIAARTGVAVLTTHAILSLRHESLDQKLAADVASIRTAATIDSCRSIVLHPPTDHAGSAGSVEWWLDAIVKTRERERPSLDLALENRAENWDGTPAQWLDDIGRLTAIAGEWGMRVCLDLAHAASFGLDLASAIQAARPQLINVHLSDAHPRRFRGGLLNGLFRDHALPGSGILAIDDALTTLAALSYRGPLTLELSPVSQRAWLPSAPRCRLSAAVADIRQRVDAQSASPGLTRHDSNRAR